HPLAEPLRAARELGGRPDDDLAAAGGELLQPERLDLALRVQPEVAFHPDLDPEPLAVEPVLVALVEAAQRLVALEHVLHRPAPRGVDAEVLLVRRHRAVEERPGRPAAVLLAQLLERPLALPEPEHVELERVRLGRRRERIEHALQSNGSVLEQWADSP